MRRTKQEAERTRKQLMGAGLRVFGSKGYAAARLSDIASSAGVTRGAVYWHFGSKKGLMFAILREMVNPYIEIAVEVLESELEPARKIREMISRVMNAMNRQRDFLAREQLAIRFMAEHPSESEEYHGDASGGMRRVTSLTRCVIRDGQRTGEIRADVDAKIITGTIAAILRGSAMMKNVRHLDLLPRGTSEAVVDLVMRGLEPR